MVIHEKRMKELIDYTSTNKVIPYGCSIYDETGKLLVKMLGNKHSPINHAEILAIKQCTELYPNLQWDTLTLYSTGEPCCMCAAACCWVNLKEVVYATGIPLMVELWGIEGPLRASDIMNNYPKRPKLTAGVCEEISNMMFKECKDSFFELVAEKSWK
ncbi:hypothetical protein AYO45_00650 [Gammaproteobacteria bacterium SCGC AG-212-F23]|nr:hypothetical protein AYO45_00650 [Gammaproteobacteria bacterium SCGC AG-212-F23]